MDLVGALHLGLIEIICVFFFVDLFDNVGTLVGVCEQGKFLVDGKLPRAGRALLADAIGTTFGALTGTSTVTSYIESAAGVAAGARTGLGNISIAGLFLIAPFFAPLVSANSVVRDRPGADSGRRVDVRGRNEREVGRFQRGVSGFPDNGGDTIDIQRRHRLEPRADFFYNDKSRRRPAPRNQPLIWILTALFVLRYAYLAAG